MPRFKFQVEFEVSKVEGKAADEFDIENALREEIRDLAGNIFEAGDDGTEYEIDNVSVAVTALT